MYNKLIFPLLACCTMLLFSCIDKQPAASVAPANLSDEIKTIEKYCVDHQLTAQSTPSGLHYIITTEGTGEHPASNALVSVRYKGYLLDGTVFDQTRGDKVLSYPLKDFIEGWKEGIPLLKKGGKGTFFVPSSLGYGTRAAGQIPPNSILAFEVELVDF